jgi:hypothetical protein
VNFFSTVGLSLKADFVFCINNNYIKAFSPSKLGQARYESQWTYKETKKTRREKLIKE